MTGIEWDGNGRARLAAAPRRPEGLPLLAAWLAAAVVLIAAIAPAPALVRPRMPQASVIVRAVPGGLEAAAASVRAVGGSVGRDLGIVNGFVARVSQAGAVALRRSAAVAAVTADGRGRLLAVDPALGYDAVADLGSPSNVAARVGAVPAYAAGVTGKGVDVAVIDSGVLPVAGLTAPGKVINGPDLSFDSQAANLRYLDGFGHGTHMAGLIAGGDAGASAGDPTRFSGVAPDARILSVKVGASDGAVDVSQMIAAIDWVVKHRNDNGMNIRVLNLAFGTDATQSYTLDPLAYAAEVAWRKGIVVVVAGGNDGKSAGSLANPAIDPYVLAVGASDPRGTLDTSDDTAADFSSKGNQTRHVDLLAPGKSVLSLRAPGSSIDLNFPAGRVGTRFFRGSGTSQAAAVTSGAVALLLQHRPSLTPDQVKAILMGSARPVKSNELMGGAGAIDVAQAMLAPVPTATQSYPTSSGTGSLEAARGTTHLVDPSTDKTLTGEQDIFGQRWNGGTWAKKAWNGSSWSGGNWNGSSWSGSSWSGSSWSGSSWSGSSWSGSSWSGSSWSNCNWSSNTWNGSSWSGSSWSGSSWSGSSWSGSSWSGSSWSGSSWSGSSWS